MTPNPVFKVTPFFDAAVSETVNDTAIVTIKCKQETVPKLSNGSSFNDLEETYNPDFKVTILLNVK